MQLQIAVVACERHSPWLSTWSEHVSDRDGMVLHPFVLPNKFDVALSRPQAVSDDALSVLCRRTSGAPRTGEAIDVVVVLVNGDTVPWARKLVRAISASSGPIAFVTRSVQPTLVLELLRCGGRDFIAWDCRREELLLRLRKLAAGATTTPAPSTLHAGKPLHPRLAHLIGSGASFVAQLERVPVLAACDASVLILGETGTGKELFAQALHYMSARLDHPLVAVNCGALPAELVEAELFGHARGAFTSAHETRVGLVAQAQGGTLFLDEVDSLPPLAQVKLLRFLQDKEYRPVGSSRPQRADVRIISASNGDLAGLCERGTFRADLYYRLDVLTLSLPPLRERGEDVIALAEHFADRFARQFRRRVGGLAPDARARLRAHAWPGNVRELEHTIERAVLLAPGEVLRAADLDLRQPPTDLPVAESFQAAKARVVEQFERRCIENALALSEGNITHAADSVSKNRRAFWQLMRKYGIDSLKYRYPHRPESSPAARQERAR